MCSDIIQFTAGNMSAVTTDGKTVYRDMKPQSAAIHRLLQHLERKGIDFCPKFLGLDEQNQEMVSFVNGFTMDEYPQEHEISKKIETVRTAAVLLKKYHDATLDFKQQEDDIWFLDYNGGLKKEVVCHNDFAPYNVTFERHLPVGIIDFDTACPAPRLWDIAYAVYRFVPLSREVYDCTSKQYRPYQKDTDAKERSRLLKEFLEAYGPEADIDIIPYVLLRLQALVDTFDIECAKGSPAFLKMKSEGHQDYYVQEIKFIHTNLQDWK